MNTTGVNEHKYPDVIGVEAVLHSGYRHATSFFLQVQTKRSIHNVDMI